MVERVLLVVDSLRPSGPLTQALTLASRLTTRGFEPQLCVLDAVDPAQATGGMRPFSCQRRHAADPLAAWRLRRVVRRLRPSIVHAWGDPAADYAAAAAGRAKRVATIGRVAPDPPAWRKAWRRRRMGRIDRLVATSHHVAEQLGDESRGPHAEVIAPGVAPYPEPDAGCSLRAEVLDEIGLPADTRVIVATARLEPRKGVRELVWCADLVRVLRKETRLLVVGEGPEAPALARFARLAGEPGQVRFLGSRRDVGRLLGAADVYWHAGDEGSAPIAVVEAMAAGVPVVADDTPGCRQALTDGVDGRLCPAGARAARGRATEQLLAGASYRGRLADAARETAGTRFSADRMADDYARAYRRLLA